MALTPAWTRLRAHVEQSRLWRSTCRFAVIPPGRRSGKTEIAKRKAIRSFVTHNTFPNGRYVCAAPTHQQAKNIYWRDLKQLYPKDLRSRKDSDGELKIHGWNGATLEVMGLDVPARLEGPPLDGIVLDEFANMKAETWQENVRPALSDRKGWAWFVGVPEGRNHFYDLWTAARSGELPDWDTFHWFSSDILDPEEIEAAKREMDELTYQQEYEGSFVTFLGRAYYNWTSGLHDAEELHYDPKKRLVYCFDFNKAPGVAAIVQEMLPIPALERVDETHVIDEVWNKSGSFTVRVCRQLIEKYPPAAHQADVWIYGDPSGGVATTQSQPFGSDWEQIRAIMYGAYGKERVTFAIDLKNPFVRVRVNAVNARMLTLDGKIHLRACPKKAKHSVIDFEKVVALEDGSVEKKKGDVLGHLSEAIGYYICRKHPMRTRSFELTRM